MMKMVLANEVHKLILENLFSLYGHDISEYTPYSEVGDDGAYAFEDVDDFLHSAEHMAFLFYQENKPIGFLLMGSGELALEGCEYIIYDFFVLRKYRRTGMGTEAMKMVFDQYPGKYCVSDLVCNVSAVSFWRKLIARYAKAGTQQIEEEFVAPTEEAFLCQIFEV